MTQEDIIRMAREAHLEALSQGKGMHIWHGDAFISDVQDFCIRFAALVAAAERNACAKVCEETTASWTQDLYNSGCMDCAAAIRARGET